MEFTVFFLGFVWLYMQNVDSVSGLSLRLLNEKMDILEAKLSVENKQRHTDYENIMSKLNEITTQLEQRDNQPSIAGPRVGTTEDNSAFGGGTKSASNINDQLQYLIKGLIEEKRVNGKARQKLPNIERKLEEINHRMKRELSRLDSEITTASLACKEHTENVSHRIKDLENVSRGIYLMAKTQNQQLTKMETEMQGTNDFIETLSNNFKNSQKRNDEQFDNITSGIDVIVTSHSDRCEKIGKQLEDMINKQCETDSIRKIMVTSTESLTTNVIPDSTEEMHVTTTELPKTLPDSTEKTNDPPTNIISFKDAYSSGIKVSGVYVAYNAGNGHYVYCDQTTDGGGWTVFQRRKNGDVDFFRDWDSYKMGFGDLTGEFWLGNEYLSTILGSRQHELRIDLEDFEGNRAYAQYNSFLIDPESNHYTLHVSGFSGNAGNALDYHNGQNFSTKDVDLDLQSSGSCSNQYKGGWWYKNCYYSNLNGLYHISFEDNDGNGLIWYKWKGWEYSLKFVEMKFRSI